VHPLEQEVGPAAGLRRERGGVVDGEGGHAVEHPDALDPLPLPARPPDEVDVEVVVVLTAPLASGRPGV